MFQSDKSNYLQKTFFLFLIVVSVFGILSRANLILSTSPFLDFNLYFVYADMVSKGVNPFDQNIIVKVGGILQAANYPPLFYFFMHPFTLVSFETASQLWFLTNMLLIFFIVLMIFRIFPKSLNLFGSAIVIFLIANYYPIFDNNYLGQANVFILFLLILGLFFAKKKNLFVSSILIACVVFTKIQFILFVPLLFAAGYKRLSLYAFAMIIMGVIISLFLFGWEHNGAYVKYLVAFPRELYSWVGNISLTANFLRIVGFSESLVVLITFSSIAFLGYILNYINRNKRYVDLNFVWSISILTIFVVVPLLEIHHLAIVFLPVCFFLFGRVGEINLSNIDMAVGVVSLFLLSVWIVPNPPPDASNTYLIPVLMIRTSGLLGLFWVLIRSERISILLKKKSARKVNE